ncbi:MAG: hypothetical protein DID92_2727744616 [Candidatus Nitrotoga sp. SPKER]|nr:MAG: hypothetical protein DID92_2727744616 [Candidatus Nitrotoga sp. SPKER]
MASNKLIDCLPSDLLPDNSAAIYKSLSKKSAPRFESLCKVYETLCSRLDGLPEDVSLIAYSTYDPKQLSAIHPGGLNCQVKLCESLLFIFVYTHFYKLKQMFQSLNLVLLSRNYLSAGILSRSAIEHVAFFFYFLRRIEDSTQKIIQSFKHAKRGRIDVNQWNKGISQTFYDLFSNLDKATRGSRYDWSKLHNSFDSSQLPNSVNVLTCIKELVDRSNFPIDEHYTLFSEMAHPNFGSHTMLIKTRVSVSDHLSQVVLGETTNLESSLWFFDMFSEGLDEMVKLSLVSLERGNNQLNFFKTISDLCDHNA